MAAAVVAAAAAVPEAARDPKAAIDGDPEIMVRGTRRPDLARTPKRADTRRERSPLNKSS